MDAELARYNVLVTEKRYKKRVGAKTVVPTLKSVTTTHPAHCWGPTEWREDMVCVPSSAAMKGPWYPRESALECCLIRVHVRLAFPWCLGQGPG